MPFIWFLRINRYSTPTIWILVKQLTHCWWDKCILYSIFDIPSYLSLLKIGPVFFQRIYTCDKVKREWDCTTNTSGPLFEITGFDLIWFIVLNTTFSNISAISWRPVLVVDEAEYPERTTDHGQATGKLYHLWVERTFFVIYKAGWEPTSYWW
jgi:hypothetical protein